MGTHMTFKKHMITLAVWGGAIGGVTFMAPANAGEIQPGDIVEFSHSQITAGAGGGAWIAEKTNIVNSGEIDRIEVCHGRFIDGLTFFYNGRRGTKFGTSSGSCEFYNVPKTSFIKEVIVWRGDWVNAVQFITADGQESEVYGDPAGGARVPVQDPNGGALRQVNGKFGNYVNQLELKFGLPYYVDDIDIQIDKPIKEMRFSKPKQIDVNIGNNCGNSASAPTFNSEFKKSATQTHNFTFSNTTGVELSTEFKVGAPVFAEGKIGVSASTAFTFETSDGAETTDEVTKSFNYSVPPLTRIDAAYVAKEAVVKLPFTYNLYHYRNGNRKDHLPPKTFTGVYDGVLIASAETQLYEVDCKTGERVQEFDSADDIEKMVKPDPVEEALPPVQPGYQGNPGSGSGEPAPETLTTAIQSVTTTSGAVFHTVDSAIWHELSDQGEIRFTFEEIDRNADCIYLIDIDRGVLIILDLARNKVQYAPSIDDEPFDIYDIVTAS